MSDLIRSKPVARPYNMAGMHPIQKGEMGEVPIAFAISIEHADKIIRAVNAHDALVTALSTAVKALHEAEAILGGEYGDHYGVLCQLMLDLERQTEAALTLAGVSP